VKEEAEDRLAFADPPLQAKIESHFDLIGSFTTNYVALVKGVDLFRCTLLGGYVDFVLIDSIKRASKRCF
jgi:hypothetical protein